MLDGSDQLNLIRIGRMIEKEYPDIEFETLEDMRVYVNEDLGVNIKKGMKFGDVATTIFNGRLHRAHRNTYGIV